MNNIDKAFRHTPHDFDVLAPDKCMPDDYGRSIDTAGESSGGGPMWRPQLITSEDKMRLHTVLVMGHHERSGVTDLVRASLKVPRAHPRKSRSKIK